jgi:hypothetical protein
MPSLLNFGRFCTEKTEKGSNFLRYVSKENIILLPRTETPVQFFLKAKCLKKSKLARGRFFFLTSQFCTPDRPENFVESWKHWERERSARSGSMAGFNLANVFFSFYVSGSAAKNQIKHLLGFTYFRLWTEEKVFFYCLPFLFIRGFSCPRRIQTSLTQIFFKLAIPEFSYNLLPVFCGDIGFFKKHRSSIGLEIRPQMMTTNF